MPVTKDDRSESIIVFHVGDVAVGVRGGAYQHRWWGELGFKYLAF